MFQLLWFVSMSTKNDPVQYSGMRTTWGSLRMSPQFMACQVGVHWLLITNLTMLLFHILSVLFIQHHLTLQSLLHTPQFNKIQDYVSTPALKPFQVSFLLHSPNLNPFHWHDRCTQSCDSPCHET
jgi:hypothetical protein